MYDGAVAYMDACIAAVLNRLEELGQTDNTLVVFTADHGETLDEHGCYFDHHGLYEPTLHVPLILSQPGRIPQGQRVKGYTLHEDLMPTLLSHAGLDEAVDSLGLEGRSVLPLVTGGRATNHSEFYITECTWMRKRGWRTPEWKLIEAMEPDFHGKPPIELYNLVNDPGENVNLADQEPGVVSHLRDRMNQWVEARLAQTGKARPDHAIRTWTGKAHRLDCNRANPSVPLAAYYRRVRESCLKISRRWERRRFWEWEAWRRRRFRPGRLCGRRMRSRAASR